MDFVSCLTALILAEIPFFIHWRRVLVVNRPPLSSIFTSSTFKGQFSQGRHRWFYQLSTTSVLVEIDILPLRIGT